MSTETTHTTTTTRDRGLFAQLENSVIGDGSLSPTVTESVTTITDSNGNTSTGHGSTPAESVADANSNRR